jgi:hypothetical protein
MAEDIATELGRFRELDVIAPATALAYRDAAVPPEGVASELGVAYALAGSLRPMRQGFRITVRLVETDTARQLWAERYDCAKTEVFDVQDDVARRIVASLVGRIEDARLEAARRKRPEDLEAYDLWLRGWSALRRPDLAALGQARQFFQQAVARDPHFARAYVGLAMANLNEWACFSWNHWFFLRQEAMDLAPARSSSTSATTGRIASSVWRGSTGTTTTARAGSCSGRSSSTPTTPTCSPTPPWPWR